MWISRKKDGKQPKILQVSTKHVLKVKELHDKVTEGGTVSKYKFWMYIAELFPETETGDWSIIDTATGVFIKEILK